MDRKHLGGMMVRTGFPRRSASLIFDEMKGEEDGLGWTVAKLV